MQKIVIYVTNRDPNDPLCIAIVNKLAKVSASVDATNKDTIGGEVVSAEVVNITTSIIQNSPNVNVDIIDVLEKTQASLCMLAFSGDINSSIIESARRYLAVTFGGLPVNYGLVTEDTGKQGPAFIREPGSFIYNLYFVEHGQSSINEVQTTPTIMPAI